MSLIQDTSRTAAGKPSAYYKKYGNVISVDQEAADRQWYTVKYNTSCYYCINVEKWLTEITFSILFLRSIQYVLYKPSILTPYSASTSTTKWWIFCPWSQRVKATFTNRGVQYKTLQKLGIWPTKDFKVPSPLYRKFNNVLGYEKLFYCQRSSSSSSTAVKNENMKKHSLWFITVNSSEQPGLLSEFLGL